jgi:hypothetical protein
MGRLPGMVASGGGSVLLVNFREDTSGSKTGLICYHKNIKHNFP